jgi:hypothetical protein
MPIPAQTTSTASVDFDSLLLRSLIFSGADACSLILSRVSAATGIEQPGSVKSFRCNDATMLTALRTLIDQFITSRSLVGDFVSLTLTGRAVNGVIGGSMRLILDSGVTAIPDVYAEAAKDAAFATLLTDFLAAIGTYNASAKVI